MNFFITWSISWKCQQAGKEYDVFDESGNVVNNSKLTVWSDVLIQLNDEQQQQPLLSNFKFFYFAETEKKIK